MDLQHQKLIELINKLYKMIRNNEPSELVKEVLNEMTDYADMHLQEEEAFLKANGYPGLTDHIALHQNYLDKLKTLVTQSNNENETTVKDTYAFLREWWMNHIVAEDKKYGEFLKAKGM